LPGFVDTLNDFGLAPRKRSEPDHATKVKMAAKVRATRAARHTLGKEQKLAPTGEPAEAPFAPALAAATPIARAANDAPL
jgi:hypothetical protein